jgi:AcrR family transcriptional regulator
MPIRSVQEPRHAARATRTAGQQTRSRLLDEASRLFKERGLGAVSIADIAAAADAFPSQITYYFHTKEALFVEAACRDVLHVARAAEEAAHNASTPEDYTRALVDSVMRADAVGFFVEAMTLTRRRGDLAPLIARTVERLHQEGLRAYAGEVQARAWRSRSPPELTARRFWTVAVGVTLEGHAMGRSPDELVADMLRLLDTQADAQSGAGASERARLRLIDGGAPAADMASDEEDIP